MNAKKALHAVHNAAEKSCYLFFQPFPGVGDTFPHAGNEIAADFNDFRRKGSKGRNNAFHDLRYGLHDFNNDRR